MSRCLSIVTLSFAVLMMTGARSAAEDWPQFRGPGGQGHSQLRDLPLEWSSETGITWKTSLPGNGWSSPVVWNGRVILTTAVNVDQPDGEVSLRVLCLDSVSGDEQWTTEVSVVPSGTTIHPKNSHASATPVVTDNRIYVHFACHGTAALDHEGNIIWLKKVEYQPQHGTGSSPVLFEDLLIFNCDGLESPFVTALDASTGDERWRTARPDIAKMKFSFSTPLVIDVDGRSQLISSGSDVVCSYDPRTGEQRWMVRYPEKWSVVPRPVYAEGLVLVCTGFEGPAELLAIRPDGRGDVTDTHVVWRADRYVPHSPSPIVYEGHVYLMSDNGIASCRDLQSGQLRWRERVGGAYSASPIQAEGRLYFMSEDGVCTVIRAAPQFEQLARNSLQERSLASIVPTDGSLLIRTIEGLYRID